MSETAARKRRQKGEFLLRLLGRALEDFHGDFPSAHKRCGTSRASHKRDAVCLASTILPGQRQLFFPIGDNYSQRSLPL